MPALFSFFVSLIDNPADKPLEDRSLTSAIIDRQRLQHHRVTLCARRDHGGLRVDGRSPDVRADRDPNIGAPRADRDGCQ